MQDQGIEARKAAFECLSALLDSYPNVLGLEDVLKHVGNGLKDDYDVKLLAIQICCKLASSPLTNSSLLPHIDNTLTAALESVLFPAPKKGEEEEASHREDEKKKAMRIVVLLKRIPGIFSVDTTVNFAKLVNSRLDNVLMKEADEALSSNK